jgi:TonB family protein
MKWKRAAARWAVAVTCVLSLAACGGGEYEVIQEPVPMPAPSPVEYPVSLWDRRVQGETEVLIYVNVYGDVDSARVSKTSGYQEFDSAAVRGARQLRFTPGRRANRPVAMWTKVPVRFAQDSTAEVGSPLSSGIPQ